LNVRTRKWNEFEGWGEEEEYIMRNFTTLTKYCSADRIKGETNGRCLRGRGEERIPYCSGRVRRENKYTRKENSLVKTDLAEQID
jgi:hypothetical protein